jgi:hypothetical protein
VTPDSAPLRVHIDTLVVPAGSRRDGERIGLALRAELGRVLAAAPRPSQPVAVDTLAAGPLRLDAGDAPDRTGARLARMIAAGLERLA